MYDTIIIGAGPAGFTAGIYAARRQMKTLIIGKEPGGQIALASEIENYPGFKKIDSYELISKMQEQVSALGVEIKISEVKAITRVQDGTFNIACAKEEYKAKTIILALGLAPRRLGILGENEFIGKGVSYCANCDGPFYHDKIVAIIGGGNAALDAAEVMSKIAKKTYLIHRRAEFRAFEVLTDKVRKKENVEMVLNSEVVEISGEQFVKKIKVANKQTKENKEIEVNGVFIEIGRAANTALAGDFVERDEAGQIIVDQNCATKTSGIFAAGDCVVGDFKQITIAVGSATIAALAAYQYLQLKKD